MSYSVRERIYSACGPDLYNWTPVFATSDLTDDECHVLEESVQRCLNDIHDECGSGPWHFQLGPSADEDCVAFINLKSDWKSHEVDLEKYRKSSGNSWQSEVIWLHDIVQERANIIRQIRRGRNPVIYLQCDEGRGFETFDRIDSLTESEIETLEEVLFPQLNEMGLMLRVVDDWYAEKEPAAYVQARLSWKRFEESLNKDKADDTLLAASGASFECCEEIKELRKKPLRYASDEFDEEHEDEVATPNEETRSTCDQTVLPHESNRDTYRDPDNYWRNVWLYQQRQEGRTNSTILSDLSARATEFAPIESENALRSAIESIAHHHRWPLIKGRPGRPRAKADTAQPASSQQSNQQRSD